MDADKRRGDRRRLLTGLGGVLLGGLLGFVGGSIGARRSGAAPCRNYSRCQSCTDRTGCGLTASPTGLRWLNREADE